MKARQRTWRRVRGRGWDGMAGLDAEVWRREVEEGQSLLQLSSGIRSRKPVQDLSEGTSIGGQHTPSSEFDLSCKSAE